MTSHRRRGFTLAEILVATAILAILFGLMFRPLLMAAEILSLGTSQKRAETLSRAVLDQLTDDVQAALYAYPNTACFDLASAAGTTDDPAARWRTAQPQRLDLVGPARAGGQVVTPVRPATSGAAYLVTSYWRMRRDPSREWDPQLNPYQLWRATHPYTPTSGGPRTPDDLWAYALAVARSTGESLSQLNDNLLGLFYTGSPTTPAPPFAWLVADLDRATPTATNRVMRMPTTGDPATNATDMVAVTTLTDSASDLRRLEFLPVLVEAEELRPNEGYSAYRGSLRRWVEPYQRATPGPGGEAVWVLPSSDVVAAAGAQLPVVAVFRARSQRATGLAQEYFLTIDQDPTSPTVGHPLICRWETGNVVPVYDTTEYPVRAFRAAPGQVGSAEFAAGLDYASGEILLAFPQQDVICPSATPLGSPGVARLHALNDYDPVAGPGAAPVYQAGSANGTDEWQSFPLTVGAAAPGDQVGGRPLDEFVADQQGGSDGVWASYTLSAFRPARLGTNVDDGTLDMSLIPGSEQVVVVQYAGTDVTDALSRAPVRRRTYTPLRTLTGQATNAGDLAPFRYHLDPSSGRLTFYDPQLDADATTARDGLNPPAIVVDPAGSGQVLVPVIYVTYEYRNNLPRIDQVQLGDSAQRDVVEATYRSLAELELTLVLDVPTDSTRGETETVDDPLAAAPLERPTGSRRRVSVQTRLVVGAAL